MRKSCKRGNHVGSHRSWALAFTLSEAGNQREVWSGGRA